MPEPPSQSSKISELREIINRETAAIDDYLQKNSLPQPSFDQDAPTEFPAASNDPVQKSRRAVINATDQLRDLLIGPREKLRRQTWSFNNVLSVTAAATFNITQAVPVDGEASFSEIADVVKLPPHKVRQIVRHCITNNIFYEPSPGRISHTSASRTLHDDETLRNFLSVLGGEVFRAAAGTLSAMQDKPDSQEPTEAGFSFGHNVVGTTLFQSLSANPARAKLFAIAMASLSEGDGFELSYLVDAYPWAELGDATIVDVGGSHGFVCIALADKFPRLKFVVQDLPRVVSSVRPGAIPESVQDRIEFVAHDFFEPQPAKDADVFFFRWIFHNWSDKYARKMLEALIPALKPGARVVINDICLRLPGEEDAWDNWMTRNMDMTMLELLNARERDDDDYRQLFAEVDSRFKYKGCRRLDGYRMGVLEAVWEP